MVENEHEATIQSHFLGSNHIAVKETEPAEPEQPPSPRLRDLPDRQQGSVFEGPSRHQQHDKLGNDSLSRDDTADIDQHRRITLAKETKLLGIVAKADCI